MMNIVEALKRELAGYVARGMDDRAELVRDAIVAAGGTVDRPAKREARPAPDVEVETSDVDGPTCDECGRTFKNDRGLAIHVGSSHG